MVDFEKEFGKWNGQSVPGYVEAKVQIAATFRIVYGWMCAGLALSGVVAWYVASTGAYKTILSGPGLIICVVAELALVLTLSAAIGKIPVALAYLLYAAYAAVNGLTLSVVFLAYELSSVTRVFFITAATFGGVAVYGTVTKNDLTGIGSFCGMALWGLIVALVVNMFLGSGGLDILISFAGVIIFTGLTMYDAQKIKQVAAKESTLDSAAVKRLGIMGALSLYLDFVNLFLYALRILGKRR
ncbi:MAG: Bax inhibitor-1/YccA family protein [Kiritimatiellae bacterium]|nr:Bax inhibitor-1/YccA family protein [Kiritimatiellia bacterium]